MTDNLEFKLDALDGATAYPNYKEEKDVCTIEVESFDYLAINEIIRNNDKLTNFEGTVDLLVELVQLLGENRTRINLMLLNTVTFYWNNYPILVIKYKGTENPRMMAISVKRYKDALTDALHSQKIGRIVGYSVMGVLSLVCIGASYAYFSRSKSTS